MTPAVATLRKRAGHFLIAAGASVAAVLALSPSAALAQPAVTFPTKPLSGTCHQWKYDAVRHSYHGRMVPCSRPHDVVTIAVPNAPRSLAGLSTTAIESVAASTCEPLMLKRLGRTAVERETSDYRFLFGHPGPSQIAEGERWVRCDLTLTAGRRLLPLPTRLPHPILRNGLSDATERCVTASGLETTCSRKHAYRPIGAVTFRRMTYPTRTAFGLAARRCPSGTAWLTWSAKGRWAAGDRVLVCYAKTRK